MEEKIIQKTVYLAKDGKPFGLVVDGVRGYCFGVVYFLDLYEAP